MSNLSTARKPNSKLVLIVMAGLLLRILFIAYGARIYYGVDQGGIYYNGDSHSYSWSFQNLINNGDYTFDYLQPDAYFGRLPGYPFFYGIHYLLFGPEYAALTTASSQVLLDTCSIILAFLIIRRLFTTSIWMPLVGAGLYALYPFAIVWVTIIGTETLGTFLVLLWLYVLLRPQAQPRAGYYLGLGVLLALVFYVREFLGITLALTLAYVLSGLGELAPANRLRWSPRLRNCLLICVGFGALYVWWPVRNYVNHNRIMLVKPTRAGYANYEIDIASYRDWVQCWSNDLNVWMDQVAYGKVPQYPDEVFSSFADKALAQRLSTLAYTCGSSFYLYRTKQYATELYRDTAAMRANKDYWSNCNPEISRGFETLKAHYVRDNFLSYCLRVPSQNLVKALFKNSKTKSASIGAVDLILTLLFSYRTVLLFLGFAGLIVFNRNRGAIMAGLFVAFIYLFICFYMRSLEMRYLLQADIVLLLPAAMLIGSWADRWLNKQSHILANSSSAKSAAVSSTIVDS